jgi:hypothetical protein
LAGREGGREEGVKAQLIKGRKHASASTSSSIFLARLLVPSSSSNLSTYLDVKFSEAISTKDSCCRIFSCSMIAYKSGSVFNSGSFNAVAHDLVSEVMLL